MDKPLAAHEALRLDLLYSCEDKTIIDILRAHRDPLQWKEWKRSEFDLARIRIWGSLVRREARKRGLIGKDWRAI